MVSNNPVEMCILHLNRLGQPRIHLQYLNQFKNTYLMFICFYFTEDYCLLFMLYAVEPTLFSPALSRFKNVFLKQLLGFMIAVSVKYC